MTETEKFLSKISTIQERLKEKKKIAEKEAAENAMRLDDLFEDKDVNQKENKRQIYLNYMICKTEARVLEAALTQIDVTLSYG